MGRIGVRELRQHASRYLARVRAGETVEVTDRGELVALLVPPVAAANARERLIAAGRLIPGTRPPYIPRRAKPAPGAVDTATALAEQRDERL